jgi:hypothetical protein
LSAWHLDAGLERRALPSFVFAVDVPRTVQHQMRAQGGLLEADDQVLAARAHILDSLAHGRPA